MSEDHIDDPFRLEREGTEAGVNPMFGEWQQEFKFAPIPYGDGGIKRQAFREAIQAELNNRWIYSHEIQLAITLHLDVQTILETSETADLDNYAKSILDGLKGPNGIMFDDTQVQSLQVSWLDGYGEPSFTVEARSSPDDFLLKPIEFYEMPDGLWYPSGKHIWTRGGAQVTSERDHFVELKITEMMSAIKKQARAEMRRAGFIRRTAYYQSKYVSSLARGFHRTRIADSGFPLHPQRAWQAELQKWAANNPEQAALFEKEIEGARQSYGALIPILSGKPRRAADEISRND